MNRDGDLTPDVKSETRAPSNVHSDSKGSEGPMVIGGGTSGCAGGVQGAEEAAAREKRCRKSSERALKERSAWRGVGSRGLEWGLGSQECGKRGGAGLTSGGGWGV